MSHARLFWDVWLRIWSGDYNAVRAERAEHRRRERASNLHRSRVFVQDRMLGVPNRGYCVQTRLPTVSVYGTRMLQPLPLRETLLKITTSNPHRAFSMVCGKNIQTSADGWTGSRGAQ